MRLKCEEFRNEWDLRDFVNGCGITPEQIQQITHAEYLAGWSTVCRYTLFYWGE